MCKPRRNPKLLLVLSAQYLAYPMPVGFRTLPNVDRNIKYFPLHDPQQLSLGLRYLIVQTAKDIPYRLGVIVLDKGNFKSCRFLKSFLVETFEEKAAIIDEHFGFDYENILNCRRHHLH